jgi:2-dehydropantoate 2-reductase
MKICIIGAGAIGGFIGTRLALTGQAQVSALARGETLAALRSKGWRVSTAQGLLQTPAVASDNATELGVQDLVIIAVKGPALAAVAASLGTLLGPETVVMPAMNGVPWWFCEGLPSFVEPLPALDPNGAIARAIPLRRVLACVVHGSMSTPEPGLVQHKMGQGLIIGEPLGGISERAERIGELFKAAHFDVTVSANVRYDIWYKLWGNLTTNPITAITGTTVDKLLNDPDLREFCSAAMREAALIGERIGCPIMQSAEDRHVITAKLGAFKTSMLQDVEAGRPIELDSIVTAVVQIGQRLGVATPCISGILGLTRVFAQLQGLYPKV